MQYVFAPWERYRHPRQYKKRTKKILKLSEDQVVVEALKHILEDYDFLEYDEVLSKNENYLRVKIIRRDMYRHSLLVVRPKIIRVLEKTTNKCFMDAPTFWGLDFFTIYRK